MIRYGITFILLVGTAILHSQIGQLQAQAAQVKAPQALFELPRQILEFQQLGEDIPASESVRQQLETNAILQRNYASAYGGFVQLTIVYAGKTRRSLHFPEVCFTGQGWETQDKFSIPVGLSFVGQGLILQNGDSRQAVLYFFKTGDNLTGNYFANSLSWVRDTFLLRSPSSMLVRISAPVDEQNEDRAIRLLNDFASGLAPILLETIP
jgi:EpsI family protein